MSLFRKLALFIHGQRLKLKWGMGAILLTILLLYALPFAAAQSTNDRPPLALSKVVTPEPAVAGDTLTYLITLTNTGQLSLEGVTVIDTTSVGTTIFGANGPSGWWVTTTSGQGQPGQVIWRPENPLLPGEVVTLGFIVSIASAASGPIVSDEYEARAEGWAKPVSGPPVVTELIAPTPTWTLPPLPTKTPTETPLATPTKIPTKTPAATAAAPPTVTLEQVHTSTEIHASSPAVSSSESREVDGGRGMIIWVGIVVLVIVLVVVFFVVKRRQ